jgi:hypothetical protein
MLIVRSFAGLYGAAIDIFPEWVLFVGVYFFVESALRAYSAFSEGAPRGSFPVVLAYLVYEQIESLRKGRGPGQQSDFLPLVEPTSERLVWDSFRIREPLFSFLSRPEQELAVVRYGFECVKWGKRTSVGLLVFAGLNAVLSITSIKTGLAGPGEYGWFAAASYLTIEQLVRLASFVKGVPMGGVLGFVVRPITRRFLRSVSTRPAV